MLSYRYAKASSPFIVTTTRNCIMFRWTWCCMVLIQLIVLSLLWVNASCCVVTMNKYKNSLFVTETLLRKKDYCTYSLLLSYEQRILVLIHYCIIFVGCFTIISATTLRVYSVEQQSKKQTNSMVWVRERTIPTERPPLVGEVIANFCE
jgi:hypothetical protein